MTAFETRIRQASPSRFLRPLILPWIILLVSCSASLAQDALPEQDKPVQTLVVLPFTVELPGEYAYLRNGLPGMLASRVAGRTGIKAVHQGKAPQDIAANLSAGNFDQLADTVRAAGADFLVLGSISDKDGGYELTTHVFPSEGSIPPRRFSRTVNTMDAVMTGVDELSWDIAAAFFGAERPQQFADDTDSDGMAAFRTAHPDKAYREGLFSSVTIGLEESGRFTLESSTSSRRIDFDAVDMTMADLDGDGTSEILLVSNTQVLLYQFTGDHFQRKAVIDLDAHLRVHAVTAADINGNGRPEVFISANSGNRPSSTILEWDGSRTAILQQSVPYYLRAAGHPGLAPWLVGQGGLPDSPVGGSIYLMTMGEDGTVRTGEQLTLPEGLTLFDFVRADINADGSLETIAIDRASTLRVYSAGGSPLWQSSVQYGASSNYFGTRTTMGMERYKPYVPTRILVHDIDRDGTVDLLIGRNRLETVRYMSQIRYWDGSSIAALTWKDNRLAPLWETRKIPGYTAGYALEDSGADGLVLIHSDGVGKTLWSFSLMSGNPVTLRRYQLRINSSAETGQPVR